MTKLLYDGFHKIESVEAEVKGKTVQREKLILPSAVGALVTDQFRSMLLVKQYRPTIGEYTWEIPAGVLDKPGLTSYETILEELKEECDIDPSDLVVIRGLHQSKPKLKYFMVPGSTDATFELFRIVCHSKYDEITVEDNDVIEARWFNSDEVRGKLMRGEFIDPKTIIAVSRYLLEGN